MHDGHIRLTPDIALKYLASFTDGISVYPSAQDAMRFMQTPSPRGFDGFAREPMKDRGLLIKPM
jgi:hypothetical protein